MKKRELAIRVQKALKYERKNKTATEENEFASKN